VLQVDLKLKICRGSSTRKILVREVKSYAATKVIDGAAKNHPSIWSSTSVAKYCAKKLPKDCSVLAVNNGKVVFQRERSPNTSGNFLLFIGALSHFNFSLMVFSSIFWVQ
jgi:hypothetical protein